MKTQQNIATINNNNNNISKSTCVSDIMIMNNTNKISLEGCNSYNTNTATNINSNNYNKTSIYHGNVELRMLKQSRRHEDSPHIPSFLPEFPPDHTYMDTAIKEKPRNEDNVNRALISIQNRQAEEALARFLSKTKALVSREVRTYVCMYV